MVTDIMFSRIFMVTFVRDFTQTESPWLVSVCRSETPINASYSTRSLSSVSVWYAWLSSWNKAVACGLVFLSGWYNLASRRYASLISCFLALASRPKSSYRVLCSMVQLCDKQSCMTEAHCSGPKGPWQQGGTAVTRDDNVNKSVPVGDNEYKNSQRAHKNEKYKPVDVTTLKSHVEESKS